MRVRSLRMRGFASNITVSIDSPRVQPDCQRSCMFLADEEVLPLNGSHPSEIELPEVGSGFRHLSSAYVRDKEKGRTPRERQAGGEGVQFLDPTRKGR